MLENNWKNLMDYDLMYENDDWDDGISSLSDLVLRLCFKGCFTSLYISKGDERHKE
jgi:hypothetical protein